MRSAGRPRRTTPATRNRRRAHRRGRRSPARCGSRSPTGCGPTSSAAGASPCPTWSRPDSCAWPTPASTNSPPTTPNGQAAASRWPSADAETRRRRRCRSCSTRCAATSASNPSTSPRRRYEAIKRASQEWLQAPWALTDEHGVYAATAYPGGRPRAQPGSARDLYLSGLGAVRALAAPPRPLPAARPPAQDRPTPTSSSRACWT